MIDWARGNDREGKEGRRSHSSWKSFDSGREDLARTVALVKSHLSGDKLPRVRGRENVL